MRFAQGKLREGSGSLDTEILRCAQDDSLDTAQARSREAFSPHVYQAPYIIRSNVTCL